MSPCLSYDFRNLCAETAQEFMSLGLPSSESLSSLSRDLDFSCWRLRSMADRSPTLRGHWLEQSTERVDDISKILDTRDSFCAWIEKYMVDRGESVHAVVSPASVGGGFRGYAYCTKHVTEAGKSCPASWLIFGENCCMRVLRKADELEKDYIEHAPKHREVYGATVEQRSVAKKTGAETPLRTLAGLCEAAGDSAEEVGRIPPMRTLRTQRDHALAENSNGDPKVSDSLFLWKRFVSSIVFEKAAWDDAPPFQLFSVAIDVRGAPPICILVCKAFLHFLRCWMNSRTRGAACADTTWKVTVAEWGLFVIAGMARHFHRNSGMRRALGLPLSLTFGPKEEPESLQLSLKLTFAFYEKYFHIKVTTFVYAIMWDATASGHEAHRKALPDHDYARDLRHQLDRAKQVAPAKCVGDKDTKGIAAWLAIGSVQFSAFNLWNGENFHEHWQEVQDRLANMGQLDLLEWLRDYVLFWDERGKKWDAYWRCGLLSRRIPGDSTYLPQVIESLHDTMKDALPQKIRYAEPTTAIRKLASAWEAVAKSRGWIEASPDPVLSKKWVFTDRLEEETAPQKYLVGSFSPRWVHGPRMLTEHLLTEDEEQWRKLTLEDLIEHGPTNYHTIPANLLSPTPMHLHVTRRTAQIRDMYVLPTYRAELKITEAIADAARRIAFPKLHNCDEVRQAKKDMGICVVDGDKVRYSISGSRLFYNNICIAFVLSDETVVCSCQDFMVGAECGHENYIRYVRLERLRDEFVPMKSATENTAAAKKRKTNAGGQVAMPSSAARLTMDDLREAARTRRERRAAAKAKGESERRQFLRRAFSSPSREEAEQANKNRERQARAKKLADVAVQLEKLTNPSALFKALHTLHDSRVSYKEAADKEKLIGWKVRKIKDTPSMDPATKTLASKLIERWVEEKRRGGS